MKKEQRQNLFRGLIILAIGSGLLLNTLGYFPDKNTVMIAIYTAVIIYGLLTISQALSK